MSLSSKGKVGTASKFLEVFNHLEGDQLAELALFFDSFGSKLNDSQKKRFFALLDERKKGRVLHVQWAKTNIWKKAQNDWNKDKTIFQQIVDRFLLADLRHKDFWGDYALLTYYQDHDLEKNFNLLWTKCEKKAKGAISKTSKEKIQLFLLYELKTNKNKSNRSTKRKDYLQLSEQNLDSFYALQKLRMACEQLNRKALIKQGEHTNADEVVIEKLSDKLTDIPTIQLYVNIYHLLKDPQNKTFYNKASNLIQSKTTFSSDIVLEATQLLMNYCIRKVNQHQAEFIGEYRKHINFLEKHDYLLDNGLLSLHHYNNYITICLIQNDLEKVLDIIKEYSHIVSPKEEGKHAETLSLLRFHLSKLDSAKCWQIIDQFHTKDKLYNFILDKIYLKLFFLDNDQAAFKTKLTALRRKLDKEETLSEHNKTNIRNFVNVLSFVMRKKMTKEVIDLNEYKDKLSPLDYAWLKKAFDK